MILVHLRLPTLPKEWLNTGTSSVFVELLTVTSRTSGCRCTPFAIAWCQTIVVGGGDGCVAFYAEDGTCLQRFHREDTQNPTHQSEQVMVMARNPTGDCVLVGRSCHLAVYEYRSRQHAWEKTCERPVNEVLAVTALAWNNDGLSLAMGSLFGAADVYDVCIRRFQYRGRFEMTYASVSQVIVRRMEDDTKLVMKSVSGAEIIRLNIFRDRYVVANTHNHSNQLETLLLGDLATSKVSDIPWSHGGSEKFVFDNESCCLVFKSGELVVIEYGHNEILGTVRSDYMSGHVLSLRMGKQSKERRFDRFTKLAYLLDTYTMSIKDIVSGNSVAIAHDSRVDWLELNEHGTMLLFRDRRQRLHLYSVTTQTRVTLLDYCSYVQWVPGSNVVVAQSLNSLCIWYNIHVPSQMTVLKIQGEVQNIECLSGRFGVVVNERFSTKSYFLDEPLIQLGMALDGNCFERAASVLEVLEASAESQAMWNKLEHVSIDHVSFHITERCAAALGDVGRMRYSRKLSKMQSDRVGIARSHHLEALQTLLDKRVGEVEHLYVLDGYMQTAIHMYQRLHEPEHALMIANTCAEPTVGTTRSVCCRWLSQSKDDAGLARLQEFDGHDADAVDLYLNAGQPSCAARFIKGKELTKSSPQIILRVAAALTSLDLHEQAGDLYWVSEQLDQAIACYVRGAAFVKAVEVARSHCPRRVVELHEAWGDHFMDRACFEMAINHFIEASASMKAVDAAIWSRQWDKATELLHALDPIHARPLNLRVACHYERVGDVEKAEKYYLAADVPEKVVHMYSLLNRWKEAHKAASLYMDECDRTKLCIVRAKTLEARGKLKDAEMWFIAGGEPDSAITMYKDHCQYDAMLRVVMNHRGEAVAETHHFLAQLIESEGNLHRAAHHYCEAGEWLSAVNMFRVSDMWRDAMRIAKLHGGITASKRVAYAWALSVRNDGGTETLSHGDIESAIEYAVESGKFEHALDLAASMCPERTSEVHLKHALFLEDEEHYQEAEHEFIRAGRAREAIDMYIHQHSWAEALRVAMKYDPSASADIHEARVRTKVTVGDGHVADEPSTRDDEAQVFQSLRFLNDECLSTNDLLKEGQRLEKNQEWVGAVQTYLSARSTSLQNSRDLEGTWLAAVSIARQHLSASTYHKVATEVVARLQDINCYETAADLLHSLNETRSAVACALAGKCWTKARELATGVPAYEVEVDLAHKSALCLVEDSDGLMRLGAKHSALDVLAEQKDWCKLWKAVDDERCDVDTTAKYAGLHVMHMISKQEDLCSALDLLCERGAPQKSHISLYSKLVCSILGRDQLQEHGERLDFSCCVLKLRKLLHRLGTHDDPGRSDLYFEDTDPFSRLLVAVHYFNVFLVCRAHGLDGLALKAAVTLLRYPDVVPVDKAYYQAGMLARELKHDNLAFVLLNRYIDIVDAIDDKLGVEDIDNTVFAVADSVPYPFEVPGTHYVVKKSDREDLRDWLLSCCVDRSVDQTLPQTSLHVYDTVYSGLYTSCHPLCVVTGYPVQPAESIWINNSVGHKVINSRT